MILCDYRQVNSCFKIPFSVDVPFFGSHECPIGIGMKRAPLLLQQLSKGHLQASQETEKQRAERQRVSK